MACVCPLANTGKCFMSCFEVPLSTCEENYPSKDNSFRLQRHFAQASSQIASTRLLQSLRIKTHHKRRHALKKYPFSQLIFQQKKQIYCFFTSIIDFPSPQKEKKKIINWWAISAFSETQFALQDLFFGIAKAHRPSISTFEFRPRAGKKNLFRARRRRRRLKFSLDQTEEGCLWAAILCTERKVLWGEIQGYQNGKKKHTLQNMEGFEMIWTFIARVCVLKKGQAFEGSGYIGKYITLWESLVRKSTCWISLIFVAWSKLGCFEKFGRSA